MFEKDELRTARKEYQCDLCDVKIKDDIREWWQQEKCPKCKRYYYLPCDPIEWCNERDVNNCIFRTKDGKCKEEHCEKMTHYCRCENFEEKEE